MPTSKTFKHSGDLGDIIFSLPALRALGGGVLYLDPEGGRNEPLLKGNAAGFTRLNAAAIASLRTLLITQPYIRDVLPWTGQSVDYNLDQFRLHSNCNNLSDMYLAAFHLSTSERDRPWITDLQPLPDPAHPIVISRTTRYLSNFTFWQLNFPQMKDQCLFVGHAKEHEIFEYTFDLKVAFRPTPTILELAQVIAGCRHFIGNPSLPHALAEAQKKSLVLEYYRVAHVVHFPRPDAQYV